MSFNPPPNMSDMIFGSLFLGVGGATGAYISILLRLIDGENLTPREKWATIFIGTVFAMVFSSIIGSFFNVPTGVSLTMGGSAVMTGMASMRIARMFMEAIKTWGAKP